MSERDTAAVVVAVDGPSGAGKSTVSRALAHRLGARYLDTGAMYRAATLAVLDASVDPDDPMAVSAVVEGCDITVGTDPADPWVCLGDRRVTGEVRSAAVTAAVSAVAAVPAVRRRLIAEQRQVIDRGGRIVVEGRDIGSVVAPDAVVRVFLTAEGAARADRRSRETAAEPAATGRDLARRDALDHRTSPLRPAPGAVVVDTTDLDAGQVVDLLADLVSTAVGPPR